MKLNLPRDLLKKARFSFLMSDSHEHAGFIAPDSSELNALFPGYQIEGLIATGGMGAVYCAVQKSLDRTVALKILPQEFSKDAAFCEGFEAEAKAMARLNHPNLIGVYDFGEVNGMLYIIMEYVPGKSIYHSAHGQAIDPTEVIRLVTGICNGLAHAHENGIIHRDIKPSNVLLDLNAHPKIGDFGLARPIERKIQEGEEIFGTPHYTAPEVVNTPHSVDYRADIFSVGVLLHELLTGKLPADDPRPPSAISHCDPRFDAIVRRATHPSPAARYANAIEMAKDLALISGSPAKRLQRPMVAPGPGPAHGGPRLAAPLRPRRMVKAKESSGTSVVIIILLIVGLGLGAYAYYNKQQPPSPPVSVEPPKVKPTPVPVVDPSTSPDAVPDTDTETPPEPGVEPKPTPKATTEELSDPETEPAPTEETSMEAQPKYDVTGFFERARKIMQDRAKQPLMSREANLKNNLTEFGKNLKRRIRSGDQMEKVLSAKLFRWHEAGGSIPKEVDSDLSDVSGIEEIYTEFLAKQDAINETFQKGLSTLSATYILGLEKQIERLRTENDEPAIKLIEKEVQLTKGSPKYFADLMVGAEPEEE